MINFDLSSDRFRDKVLGCWIGKNCGGTLGTPVEKAWGEPEPYDIWWYPELAEGGLPNDDLEMQLVWLTALEQVGPGLTARDLARYWLDHIGYNFDEYGLSKTNLRLGLEPPVSGAYNNWFVDCMGCPIRSEIWACIAPGQPRIAARYAYEDAICDHAGGESVYGELFNVALQSAGFVVEDREQLIDIAMSYIPPDCATARAVSAALRAHADGQSWTEARSRVLEATPSPIAQYSPINLGFQVIGWLWGEDFGDALCKTVNCGYDTDSSGGSVGSWLGIVAGKSALPHKWIEPFVDAISTNESWGGVRHFTDGTTPIPTNLPELADRILATARRVLTAHGKLAGTDTVGIDSAELYADDSVRALWERNPTEVSFPSPGIGVDIDYLDGPAAVPTSTKRVTTTLRNPHPDPIQARISLRTPSGWPAHTARTVDLPPQGQAAVEWTVDVPGRNLVDNSNRLFVEVEADGYPQQPSLPLVMIGARAARVAGPYPIEGTDEQALAAEFTPNDADWREIVVTGNEVPMDAVLDRPGTAFLQTFFNAPEQMDVLLGVDSSHPVRVWLNSTTVFTACRYRPIRPNYAGSKDGYHTVTLAAGWNELVVQIVRGSEADAPQCHIVTSTADKLHDGLHQLGWTRFPWDQTSDPSSASR